MKRNMMKIAEEDWKNIPGAYQPTAAEIATLAEMVFPDSRTPEAMFDAIGIAFRYGFELGRRYEKKLGKEAAR